jgi:hypothetical protein
MHTVLLFLLLLLSNSVAATTAARWQSQVLSSMHIALKV